MTLAHDKIEGALWGLLIGDALGVPYEFHPPESLPNSEAIDFVPPSDFARAHESIPPGTWSDDGAQALCLLASLLECGQLDEEDLMHKITHWYDNGYMAVEKVVFDVGIQTANAIAQFKSGTPAQKCGPVGEQDNGNGSLMRCLPLALWHKGSDEELIRDAHRQSAPTHGHSRSFACCALYCLWARKILENCPDPWSDAVAILRGAYQNNPYLIESLEYHIRPDDDHGGTGSGYVVDSLRSVKMVQDNPDYPSIVKSAILLGHDTDTTACIAGGIAGLKFGLAGIPKGWQKQLRGHDLFLPLLDQLLFHHDQG